MSTFNNFFRGTSAQVGIIVLAGIAAYSNSFTVPFQFDDMPSILMNRLVSDPAALLSSFPTNTRAVGYLSFALNYEFQGFDVAGFHVVNFLLHLGNALLFYRLLLLTFQTPFFRKFPDAEDHGSDASRTFVAVFSTILFLCHPLQTEAVTYIVQRLASLATFWSLLSLVTYVQSRLSPPEGRTRNPIQFALSIFFAVLAMKTKEIAFTLPMVVLLYELFFFDGDLKRGILRLTPLLATMLVVPLSLLAQRSMSGGMATVVDAMTRAQSTVSRADYFYTQLYVVTGYIRMLLVPAGQSVYHDQPLLTSFFTPRVFLSGLFLATLLASAAYLLYRSRGARSDPRQRPYLRLMSFGIFWFFGTMVVESSIFPIKDVIYEHRVYLPSLGFCIVIAAVGNWSLPWWRKLSGPRRRAVAGMLALLLLAAASATHARNDVWSSEESLWLDAVKKGPGRSFPHYRLGLLYYYQDRPDAAAREFETTVAIDPFASPLPHYYLGSIYFGEGRLDAAERELIMALRLKADSPFIYEILGDVYAGQKRFDEAIGAFDDALMLNPGSPELRAKREALNRAKGR